MMVMIFNDLDHYNNKTVMMKITRNKPVMMTLMVKMTLVLRNLF